MKLEEIISSLRLNVLTGVNFLDRSVSGGYISDMLSDVLANANEGNIWITLQTHLNIVSVASIKKISAILIPSGRKLDDDSLKKAEEEKIVVLNSEEKGFQLAGKLYKLGVGKNNE
ncbi:MAG: serine kinase [Bacteroidota bacterium]